MGNRKAPTPPPTNQRKPPPPPAPPRRTGSREREIRHRREEDPAPLPPRPRRLAPVSIAATAPSPGEALGQMLSMIVESNSGDASGSAVLLDPDGVPGL